MIIFFLCGLSSIYNYCALAEKSARGFEKILFVVMFKFTGSS